MNYQGVSDFVTTMKDRIAVVGTSTSITVLLDRPDSFIKVHLTHQEARRLAFKLLGCSDPYQAASEPQGAP